MSLRMNAATHRHWADELAQVSARVGVSMVAAQSGEQLFAFGIDTSFPQASAIKIPILLAACQAADEGDLDFTQLVTIRASQLVPGTGVLKHLRDGEAAMSWHALAVLMTVLSDNTATNLLIERLGMANIDRWLAESGFSEIRLRRIMRDIEAIEAGRENVATPRSAARLMRSLWAGDLSERPWSAEPRRLLALPKNSHLKKVLPAGLTIASKPGEIPTASTEWAVIEGLDEPLVVAMMIEADPLAPVKSRVLAVCGSLLECLAG